MRKVVLVMVCMTTLLCVKEQISIAYFNQEAFEKISSLGAPRFDQALEAELKIALESDSKKLENDSGLEIDRDFEIMIERKIISEKIEPPYKLVKVFFTGYYGPRKNQRSYYHGSFKKDVRINGAGFETACQGDVPDKNTLATDPRIIPCGSRVIMNDPLTGKEKIYIAKDKGSAIKGYKIDIFAGIGNEGLQKVRLIQKKSREVIVKVLKPNTKKS